MKKASKLLERILIAGILPLLALSSCISEKEIYPGSEGGESTVTFSIQVPGKSAPASRAMTEGQENDVKTMDILVFEPGGNYVYTARCSGTDITTDGGNIRKKSFTVKLRRGTFDLVLLGNARTLTGMSFEGKNKAAALTLVEAEMPASGKWPADGSRPFPMWGEKNGVTIDDDTDLTGNNGISLARMVARVDVQITGTATNTFELTSVHVYNYNTRGSIAPLSGQWDTSVPETPKATAPNVPASSTLTKGPLLYDGAAVTVTKCASEIYVFEAENHTGTGHSTAKSLLERTCLVIGGVYDANGDGDFTNDGDPTYYRVDFSTGSGVSPTYLDVLRNHWYTFSVTKISGAGYETADIAFESGPVNIEANVLQWNDGGVGEVYTNGQYLLSIRPSTEIEFFRNSDCNTIELKTTYDKGWEVTKITSLDTDGVTETDITSGGWITTDITSGPESSDTYMPLQICVSENTSGNGRTGYVYITAGVIRVRIMITQNTSPKRIPVFNFINWINVNGEGTAVPFTGGTIQASVYTNMGWELKASISGEDKIYTEPVSDIANSCTLSVDIPPVTTGDGWGVVSTKIWVEYAGAIVNEETFKQNGYNLTSPSILNTPLAQWGGRVAFPDRQSCLTVPEPTTLY